MTLWFPASIGEPALRGGSLRKKGSKGGERTEGRGFSPFDWERREWGPEETCHQQCRERKAFLRGGKKERWKFYSFGSGRRYTLEFVMERTSFSDKEDFERIPRPTGTGKDVRLSTR